MAFCIYGSTTERGPHKCIIYLFVLHLLKRTVPTSVRKLTFFNLQTGYLSAILEILISSRNQWALGSVPQTESTN